jgi:hypothetical protein
MQMTQITGRQSIQDIRRLFDARGVGTQFWAVARPQLRWCDAYAVTDVEDRNRDGKIDIEAMRPSTRIQTADDALHGQSQNAREPLLRALP